MDDRKKPTASFWIAVTLFVLLVVYPLSQGPYVLVSKWIPQPIKRGIHFIYAPINYPLFTGPDWFAKPYIAYLRIWNPRYAEGIEKIRNH